MLLRAMVVGLAVLEVALSPVMVAMGVQGQEEQFPATVELWVATGVQYLVVLVVMEEVVGDAADKASSSSSGRRHAAEA